MNIIKTMSAIFLIAITTLVQAEKEVIVATDTWEGYTDSNGTGYYLDIINHIFKAPEYKVTVRHMPYARSVEQVKQGSSHMVLGIYLNEEGDQLLYSHSIVEEDSVDAIISPALNKTWKGSESLEGKTVAAKIGYDFNSHFEFEMNYSEKPHVQNMLKMLAQGRLDAVLDYETEVLPLWQQSGLTDQFKIKKGVIVSSTYFGFVKSPFGEEIKKKFDEGFKALYLDGVVQDLYLKHIGSDTGLPKQY